MGPAQATMGDNLSATRVGAMPFYKEGWYPGLPTVRSRNEAFPQGVVVYELGLH